MRPSVRYTVTSDGVRIAYAVYGQPRGVPLVALRPPQWSHLEREWEMPRSHHEFESFFAERPVVRFDPRGTGLSDRRVEDQSLEARLRDLEAVVAALGLERFALDGISASGLVAIAYAARHPERVAALVVQNAFASGAEWWAEPSRRSLIGMAGVDWTVCADAWAWLTFGLDDAERVRELSRHIQACLHADDFLRMVPAEREADVRPLLGEIRAPTLVLAHPAFQRMAPQHLVQELTRGIPGARMLTVRNVDERVEAIRSFLAEHAGADEAAAEAAPADGAALAALSSREREILGLVAQGLTNRDIAERLVLSVRTVDAHVSHVYAKIGAARRAEAVAYAIRHGLA